MAENPRKSKEMQVQTNIPAASGGSAGEISPHPEKRRILVRRSMCSQDIGKWFWDGTFQGRRVVVAICRNMVEDYDKRPIKRPLFLESRSIEHHRTALILTISPGVKWFYPVHTLTGLHFLRPNFHSVQTCEDWISTYECKGTKGYDQRLGLDFFQFSRPMLLCCPDTAPHKASSVEITRGHVFFIALIWHWREIAGSSLCWWRTPLRRRSWLAA